MFHVEQKSREERGMFHVEHKKERAAGGVNVPRGTMSGKKEKKSIMNLILFLEIYLVVEKPS